MSDETRVRRCTRCSFNCPGICDAEPTRVLRATCQVEPRLTSADDTLVRRHFASAAAGVPSDSLAALFQRHERFVVAAICRITGRFDLARDLAQEVFLKALLHIDRFRLDASFSTWLFAIARNCCYDYLKAAAVRREIAMDPADLPSPAVENDALRTLERDEARRILFRLIKDARLDPMETRAFGLHYVGGLPLDGVTERLRLRNRSGAKARIVSAKRKLSRAVQRWQRSSAPAEDRWQRGIAEC
jgi:RNA polymerase sigma-70 factor (ECF subfamily)